MQVGVPGRGAQRDPEALERAPGRALGLQRGGRRARERAGALGLAGGGEVPGDAVAIDVLGLQRMRQAPVPAGELGRAEARADRLADQRVPQPVAGEQAGSGELAPGRVDAAGQPCQRGRRDAVVGDRQRGRERRRGR